MNEEIKRHSADDEGRGSSMDPGPRGGSPESQPVSFLSWRLVVWGGLISLLALTTASEGVDLWWLVLLFGLLVPAASALQAFWSTNRGTRPAVDPQDKESELLGVLGDVGELTATTAAMRTTLTVEEAAGMLEQLSRKGHLQATTQGAVVLYALWDADRRVPEGVHAPKPLGADGSETTSTVPPLVEPLTERETEVFRLLASGRTNREIAADLFVTVGTIKAHTSNIYAKLQARNRTEALSRGRELRLLD